MLIRDGLAAPDHVLKTVDSCECYPGDRGRRNVVCNFISGDLYERVLGALEGFETDQYSLLIAGHKCNLEGTGSGRQPTGNRCERREPFVSS